MSETTELTIMTDDDGKILKRWEDMAKEVVSHFEKLFSQVQNEDPTSLKQALDSQIKTIRKSQRGNGKAINTNRDSSTNKGSFKRQSSWTIRHPLKFFIHYWDVGRETLLHDILEGIETRRLHPYFTGL